MPAPRTASDHAPDRPVLDAVALDQSRSRRGFSRRALVASLGSAAAAALAGCSSPSNRLSVSGTWPTRAGNAARTGRRSGESGPEPPLDLRWRVKIPYHWHYGSPVVAGDTLYLRTARASASERRVETFVHAYDASTGDERWTESVEVTTTTNRHPERLDSLVADGDRLYCQTNAVFHALSAEGEREWSFSNTGPSRCSVDICHPVVVGETVYVGTYGSTLVRREDGTYRGAERYYALDVDAEAVQWTYGPDVFATAPTVSPSYADGNLYVCFRGGGVAVLDAETGAERWRRELAVEGSPTIDGGVAFVVTEPADETARLTALDAETGETLWNRRIGDARSSRGIASDGESLYLPADGYLVSLDAATGAERWRTLRDEGEYDAVSWLDDERPPAAGDGTPAVAGGTVYHPGGEYGTLWAVDAETGDVLDAAPKAESGDPGVASAPAVVDDAAFFAGPFDLVAVDARTSVF